MPTGWHRLTEFRHHRPLMHAVGIALGLIHRWDWGRVALRACGAVVAAAALVFLWKALV